MFFIEQNVITEQLSDLVIVLWIFCKIVTGHQVTARWRQVREQVLVIIITLLAD